MGYRFQFITLAGFHALNHSMFKLAKEFATEGMPAFVRLQKEEFEEVREGYGGDNASGVRGDDILRRSGFGDKLPYRLDPGHERVHGRRGVRA